VTAKGIGFLLGRWKCSTISDDYCTTMNIVSTTELYVSNSEYYGI
jgi:hypothetical protein